MTSKPSNSGPPQIASTTESELPELSRFLCEGFQMPASDRRLFTPALLRWKYFETRGPWAGPRSFVVRAGEPLSAHLGIMTTEFVSPQDPALAVTAVFPVDWLSNQQGGMLGAMLMLKAFSRGTVQYSLGSTESGLKVLTGAGFKAICSVPAYYKVFRPAKCELWRLIHGQQAIPKKTALVAVDLARTIFRGGNKSAAGNFALEPVAKFTGEIADVFRRSQHQFVGTSRTSELLNYFLRSPDGNVSGWRCRSGGRLAGFALTSVRERDGVRFGKIVDCFIADTDATLWKSAIQALTARLADGGCDVVQAVGCAPWFQQALRDNGFFPRGRGTFFLRDSCKAVPLHLPFHLTLLDGDQGY